MKEQTFKPVMHNSYNCDDTVVRVNEYSTISDELLSQMLSVDFPVHYNCIRVELFADSEHIESLVEDFVNICGRKFSAVLIQRVGFDSALFSVFSPNNMHYIHGELFDFEFSYVCSFGYKMIY